MVSSFINLGFRTKGLTFKLSMFVSSSSVSVLGLTQENKTDMKQEEKMGLLQENKSFTSMILI